MKLLGKKILVKATQKNPQTTANGIIVNEEAKNENGYYEGEVIFTGDDKEMIIKVGEIIQYSFKQDFVFKGEKHHLTNVENVLCVND